MRALFLVLRLRTLAHRGWYPKNPDLGQILACPLNLSGCHSTNLNLQEAKRKPTPCALRTRSDSAGAAMAANGSSDPYGAASFSDSWAAALPGCPCALTMQGVSAQRSCNAAGLKLAWLEKDSQVVRFLLCDGADSQGAACPIAARLLPDRHLRLNKKNMEHRIVDIVPVHKQFIALCLSTRAVSSATGYVLMLTHAGVQLHCPRTTTCSTQEPSVSCCGAISPGLHTQTTRSRQLTQASWRRCL